MTSPSTNRAATMLIESFDDGIPLPIYHISELYEDGQYRRIRMPDLQLQLVEDLLVRIGWVVSPGTMEQYTPYIRNYFSLAADSDRDPFRLSTLRDWIYALAYPRLRYLADVADGAEPEPPRHQPGLGKSSLQVAIAAITQAWAVNNLQAPSDYAPWRKWLRGLMRRLRQEQDRKAAILREDLLHIIHGCDQNPNRLTGLRDRAMLLLGWSAALRRSEIGAVLVDHVYEANGRWFCHVPKSKTDQMGAGFMVPLYAARDPLLDPIMSWHRWITAAGLHTGPAFRAITAKGTITSERGLTPQAIGVILKRYCFKQNISAHSLRIGYITQAKMDGFENWRVRKISRHQSDKMVDAYTRPDQHHREGPGSLV